MAKRKSLTDQVLHEAERVASDRTNAKLRAELESVNRRYVASLQTIERLEKRVELQNALSERSQCQIWEPSARVGQGTATAGLILSDWHVEERVEPDKVNGLNEYTLAIAESSVKMCFEKSLMLLDEARNLARVDDMVVGILGDLISGYIHEELEESNQMAPLPATMFAAELVESGLRELLKHGNLKQIIVPCSYGNHGRSTKRIRVSTGAENSYEHNLYHHLAYRFRDEKRIRWQIATGYHNWLDIQGYPCCFHHGDAINYWGGVGGLTIPVNKAIAQWQKAQRAYMHFFGHFHQFMWHGGWVSNGSVIGYGSYSLRIKAEYEEPRQAFFVIDRDRGLTRVLPVFCRPARKRVAT